MFRGQHGARLQPERESKPSQAKLAPPSSLIASLNTHFDFFLIQNRDCQAVFTGHTNKINCLLVSSTLNMLPCLFTGSSDETIRCYSIKVHYVIHKQKLFLLPTFMYGGRCRISNSINASFLVNILSHPDPGLPGGVLFIRQGFMFAQCLECAFCWTCQWISGQL